MKRILFLLISLACLNAYSQCHGEFIVFKNDTIIPPCDSMVIMDNETYIKYVLVDKKYSELSLKIPSLEIISDSINKMYSGQIKNTERALKLTKEQNELYKRQRDLSVDLANKYYRKNKIGKKIIIGSGILNGVLLLLLI